MLTSRVVYKALFLLLLAKITTCDRERCDRRPLGTKTDALPPDDRFAVEVLNLNNNNKYVPSMNYTVRLFSRNNQTHFIAFTLWIGGDTKPNIKNPRRPIPLVPGSLITTDSRARVMPNCNHTIIQSDISPKTFITAIWKAPPKEHRCVTIYAMVALKPDVWYDYDGPLHMSVCEETLNLEDMQPKENGNCLACEEARYRLTFEGMWSYNTHPKMYPQTRDLARFSDVVGASHSNNFYLYKYNSEATDGLKMLAEQGNTTALEIEIRKQLGSSVRTILKATGPPAPNMDTTAIFRVSPEHHLVSLVAALLPSPDWFLGVANMELCDVDTNQWAPSLVLNLYPLDAGTDSGKYFEAAKDVTTPPQPISSAMQDSQYKPFAKLKFDLIRTYPNPNCQEVTTQAKTEDDNGSNEEIIPSPTSPRLEVDPTSSPECPVSEWEEWLPCEADCIDNKRIGFRTRFRYHIVDGVEIKFSDDGPNNQYKKVPKYCLDSISESDMSTCEEDCDDTITTTEEDELSPGHGWNDKI